MAVSATGHDVAGLFAPVARAFKNDRVTELARSLATLAAGGAFDDPAFYAAPGSHGYARRLVWRDPLARFVVIGMTWGPGQQSSLHDHGGLWGAEIVVEGTLCETSFRLVDRDHRGRHRFLRERAVLRERGSVGTLIPPLEYHDVCNTAAQTARSIHVYGGDLARCTRFVEEGDGWWLAQPAALQYDA